MSPLPGIPYAQIDTVFLDAGNTLLSMDFGWVVRELGGRGVACAPDALRRAEAAARPVISEAVQRRQGTEGEDAFAFYLRAVLDRLEAAQVLDAGRRAALVRALVPVLRSRGTQRLWSEVMPRVRESLEVLRELGLRLLVVSNSDGTVERGLQLQGLRRYFHAVVDSHVVGFEKPDPRIFQEALAAAGSQPARTLHVGDIYAADVAGARAAGVHALLLDPYDDWPGVDCDRCRDLWEFTLRLRSVRG